MRIAYLDCFSGISGDMFLGAAVEAGVPVEKLQEVCSGLGLNTKLVTNRTDRGGVSAIKVDVLIGGRADLPVDLRRAEQSHSHSHPPHSHSHEHAHSADSHEHERAPDSGSAFDHRPHVHRGMKQIREIIARAPISAGAQAFALKAFELLAAAEGRIHNCDPESIHFHEVGSEDAIVDIVCAAVAIEFIAADQWYCSALNVGGGTVACAHGMLPVPAPATAELLKGAPVYSSGIQKELLTPTGAAIVRALNVRFEPLPRMRINATGYGAGARDLPGCANVVRLMLGEGLAEVDAHPPQQSSGVHAVTEATPSTAGQGEDADTITVLEANLDDMNPQLFSYVQQKLLAAGALDAFAVPVQMKKGRPGLIFTVLAAPDDAEQFARVLLTETTTLGVRMRQERRRILQREHRTVESAWGPIRIKLGRLQGQVVNCAPEFEDCRRIAEAHSLPLKTVLQEALRLYLDSSRSNSISTESDAAERAGADRNTSKTLS